MVVHKKDLTTSSNARITISYKGKKPNIRFGYPLPKDKRRGMSEYIWMNALIYTLYFAFFGTIIGYFIVQKVLLIVPSENSVYYSFSANYLIVFMFLIYKFKNNAPKISIWKTMVHNGAFYSKKFTKCSDSKILEIPLFNNVMLDYIAKGDFSRYLNRLEIREHPFKCHKIKGWMVGKQNIETLPQEYLWNAKFYFNAVPKKGSLEVFWK